MAMEKVVVQRSEGGSRRSVSPVRGGVLMQAVSRLTAEQRDRGAAAVVRQGSGDVACLLRSRPSSPARQGREYEVRLPTRLVVHAGTSSAGACATAAAVASSLACKPA